MKQLKKLCKLAKTKCKKIVFPEVGFSDRTVEAVLKIQKKGIADCILIGDESSLILRNKKLKNFTMINPKTSDITKVLALALYEERKEKGLTEDQAKELILDPFYFSTMLVKCGYADGMVAGAEVSTARTLKPALQLLKNKQDGFVNSYFMMVGKNKVTDDVFFMSDCGLVQEPDKDQIVKIAQNTLSQSKLLCDNVPKVAFLSYSTLGSAKSDSCEKMSQATKEFKEKNPDVIAEGEVQLDAAMFTRVAQVKMPNSKLCGKANILIFPELNSANICYKAVSYFGDIYAVGPITVGLEKPVNDLSRGCTVKDIIYVTAITVIQCKD